MKIAYNLVLLLIAVAFIYGVYLICVQGDIDRSIYNKYMTKVERKEKIEDVSEIYKIKSIRLKQEILQILTLYKLQNDK